MLQEPADEIFAGKNAGRWRKAKKNGTNVALFVPGGQ
jgi:hypothetical protein